MEIIRKCNSCGNEKELSLFYKTKTGHERKCKQCRDARNHKKEETGIEAEVNKLLMSWTPNKTGWYA